MAEEGTTGTWEGALIGHEIWWRDHQVWLQERGYMLRKRYRPGWIPSWRETDDYSGLYEDGQMAQLYPVLDAIRIRDDKPVFLKQIERSKHALEIDIGLFFSSDPLSSDPRNHCVPFLEVLPCPDDDDIVVVVMPFLRKFDSPDFDTVGEVVEFIRQMIEGLQFIHEHNVAHRDYHILNTMMDASPMFPKFHHPVKDMKNFEFTGPAVYFQRTARPVKYFVVDFGISRRYDSVNPSPLEDLILGGNRSLPEHRLKIDPCNPFATDIYYLGSLFATTFMEKFKPAQFSFLSSLVGDMTLDDPSERPLIDDVVSRWDIILKSLTSGQLRSRVVPKDETSFRGLWRALGALRRRIWYIITMKPALPTPK